MSKIKIEFEEDELTLLADTLHRSFIELPEDSHAHDALNELMWNIVIQAQKQGLMRPEN